MCVLSETRQAISQDPPRARIPIGILKSGSECVVTLTSNWKYRSNEIPVSNVHFPFGTLTEILRVYVIFSTGNVGILSRIKI